MADEREQDGLGRDAAHGDDGSATSGGSYGRNTGRSADDLLGIDAGAAEGGAAEAGAAEAGGGERGAGIPRGTDEQSDADDRGGQQGREGQQRGGDDATELDLRPEVGRRDPTR